MRITQKYLLQECNNIFKRLEIPFEAFEIYKTRYRSQDYEGGAAHFIIRFGRDKNDPHPGIVYIFYPLWYLQEYLNKGWELCFQPSQLGILTESELNIRQKENINSKEK